MPYEEIVSALNHLATGTTFLYFCLISVLFYPSDAVHELVLLTLYY